MNIHKYQFTLEMARYGLERRVCVCGPLFLFSFNQGRHRMNDKCGDYYWLKQPHAGWQAHRRTQAKSEPPEVVFATTSIRGAPVLSTQLQKRRDSHVNAPKADFGSYPGWNIIWSKPAKQPLPRWMSTDEKTSSLDPFKGVQWPTRPDWKIVGCKGKIWRANMKLYLLHIPQSNHLPRLIVAK